MNKYRIYTLDGERVINRGQEITVDVTDNFDMIISNDYSIKFSFDFTSNADRSYLIKQNELRDDTALYYQMRLVMKKLLKKKYVEDEDCLLDRILIVDFDRLFRNVKDDNMTSLERALRVTSDSDLTLYEKEKNAPARDSIVNDEEYGEYEEYDYDPEDEEEIRESFWDYFSELEKVNYFEPYHSKGDFSPGSELLGDKLRVLFSSGSSGEASGGMDITFRNSKGEKITRHFVAYDKSQSMARDSQICFIDQELRQALEERLWLGIEFDQIDMNLSKFYAYKGLYMSSARRVSRERIGLDDKNFAEKIIVLRDDESYEKMVNCVSARCEDESSHCFRMTKAEDRLEKIDPIFDGEGIISPKWRGGINDALGQSDETADSFQVRMPFTKGMLHTVDFHGFLREFVLEEGEESYVIKDYFGIERDLMKAEIVMPPSMFKMAKELARLADYRKIEDPMAHFGERFVKYNHAIYVSGTDLPYRGKSIIEMNYQLLGTLSLGMDELRELVDNHMALSCDPIEYFRRISPVIEDGPVVKYKAAPWTNALLNDIRFVGNTYIKNILESTNKSMKKKIAEGRICVPGENRYISRDLLYFMISIFKLDSLREKFERDILAEDSFYMPRAMINIEGGQYYPVFRNPHLSRLEQGAVRAEKKDRDSVYERYFGHLKGVIMLSYQSFVPQTLGGADFDGDILKIIDSDVIRDDVLKNNYGMTGAYEPGKVYERKAPIVVIPSTKNSIAGAGLEYPSRYSVTYRVIKDTFSSSVGLISDLAVRIGQKYYSGFDYDGPSPEECTILVGLEIDACKTGVHPDLSDIFERVKESNDSGYEYVRSFKRKIEKQFKVLKYERTWNIDKQIKLTEKNKGKSNECLAYEWRDRPTAANASGRVIVDYRFKKEELSKYSTLRLLPYFFFDIHCPENYKKYELKISSAVSKIQFFEFEADRKFIASKQELIDRADCFMSAFAFAAKLCADVFDAHDEIIRKSMVGHIFKIMNSQYDYLHTENMRVDNVMALCDAVAGRFNNIREVDEKIAELEASDWPYLASSERRAALANFLKLTVATDEADGDTENGAGGESYQKKLQERYDAILDRAGFLTDFRKRGFLLLYLFLNETRRRMYVGRIGEVYDEMKDAQKEEVLSFSEKISGITEMYEKLEAILDKEIRDGAEKRDINEMLVNRLAAEIEGSERNPGIQPRYKDRELMKILFAGARQAARRQGVSKSQIWRFFWNYISVDDIVEVMGEGK